MERLAANDLTTLATDRGQVPMNIGAVLILAPPSDQAVDLGGVLSARLAGIRRFRQRLYRPPFGAGRPGWVDDAGFDLSRHVRRSSAATTEQVLQLAGDLVCERLPFERPLWVMQVVDGLPAGRVAVILVIHHVLADGMGGLAVLASMADGMPEPAPPPPAVPLPRRSELMADALRSRVRAVPAIPAALRAAWAGLREVGVLRGRSQFATPSALLQPTSGRRALHTVTDSIHGLLDAAHRHSATVNDVILAAVSGALFEFLAERGEKPPAIVISVPVSMRRTTTADALGNQVGAAPVSVTAQPDPRLRLRAIAAATRAAKQEQRGRSGIVLSWLFRSLAAVRLGQYFVDHQHLVHTFETNLRGPAEPVVMAGHVVESIVPVAVNPGNVTVSFDVLSYAGELTVSIVSDPVATPDADRLAGMLAEQLRVLQTI